MVYSRNLALIAVFMSFLSLIGCLKNEEVECNTNSRFENQELYLLEFSGIQYLSSNPNLDGSARLCDSITPPQNVGFENIYNVDGNLISSCETGTCIEIEELRNPFCELEIPITSGDHDLFEVWQIGFITKDEVVLHPSCLFPTLSMSFAVSADSTIRQGLGDFANNSLFVEFSPSLLGSMRVDLVDKTDLPAPPYIEFFEKTIIDIFDNADSFSYTVEGNTMIFVMDQGDEIFFFKGDD